MISQNDILTTLSKLLREGTLSLWNVCFLCNDAFYLQFGAVIFRLRAGFYPTVDQHLSSHFTGPIQPQDDNRKRRVVTDEHITDDSPSLESIGRQREYLTINTFT